MRTRKLTDAQRKEHQKQSRLKSMAERQVHYRIKFNKETEADLLAFLLSHENRNGYVKALIRRDIEKEAGRFAETSDT